jgi:hypothetical protein
VNTLPIGYRSVPNPELSNLLLLLNLNHPKFSSTYIIAVTVALTVGIVGSLILYFNKKKRGLREIWSGDSG